MSYKLNKCNIDWSQGNAGPPEFPLKLMGADAKLGILSTPCTQFLHLPLTPPHKTGSKKPILLVLTEINTSFDMILMYK